METSDFAATKADPLAAGGRRQKPINLLPPFFSFAARNANSRHLLKTVNRFAVVPPFNSGKLKK